MSGYKLAFGLGLAVLVAVMNEEEIKKALKELLAWVKRKFGKNEERAEIYVEDTADEQISALLCPISHQLMEDPVMTPYGHCFEKEHIERWLVSNTVCPLTMRPLRISDLKPCYTMKSAISQYKILSARRT